MGPIIAARFLAQKGGVISLPHKAGRHRHLGDLRQAGVGEGRDILKTLKFKCGCGRTLPPVEAPDDATEFVTCCCQNCGQRWQLKIWMVSRQRGVWTNVAVMIKL